MENFPQLKDKVVKKLATIFGGLPFMTSLKTKFGIYIYIISVVDWEGHHMDGVCDMGLDGERWDLAVIQVGLVWVL